MKKRIALVHWKTQEAPERIEHLRGLGYDVDYHGASLLEVLKGLRANPPDVILIDLARMPSFGTEMGIAVRRAKTLKDLPIVYLQSDPDKAAKIQAILPDAVFTSWERLTKTLKALPERVVNPVLPPAHMERYGGSPLPQKLAIKPGLKVRSYGAPEGFEELLGTLPDGAEFTDKGPIDIALVFATTAVELELRFTRALKAMSPIGRLALIWPKKTSSVKTDLDGNVVREFGLGMGWVDYKICSVDSTWSALMFAPKKEAGGKPSGLAATGKIAANKTTAG